MSTINKTVPKSVQLDTAWEFSSIANLNLKWWQQLQGGLTTGAAVSALYLLSVIGVEGDEDIMVWIAGALGPMCLGVGAFILAVMLLKNLKKNELRGEEEQENQNSGRRISSTELEDGMFIGAFV